VTSPLLANVSRARATAIRRLLRRVAARVGAAYSDAVITVRENDDMDAIDLVWAYSGGRFVHATSLDDGSVVWSTGLPDEGGDGDVEGASDPIAAALSARQTR
jgi:hypothetical protein